LTQGFAPGCSAAVICALAMTYLKYTPVPQTLSDETFELQDNSSGIQTEVAPHFQLTPRHTFLGVSLLMAFVMAGAVMNKTFLNRKQYFLGKEFIQATLVVGHDPAVTTSDDLVHAADPCRDFEYISMEKAIYRNLGRKGPDAGPEGMIYTGADVKPIGSFNGRRPAPSPVMVVLNASTAMDFETDFTYNGMSGECARVNLKHGTSMLMTVKLLDGLTMQPAVIKSLDFTFFDLDTHATGNEVEYIKVWGLSSFVLTQNTMINSAIDHTDDSATFEATTPGTGLDNPTDPLLLTSEQKNKAVTLHFEDISQFKLELGSIDKTPHQGGHRAFIFVAKPSLRCGRKIGMDTTGGTTLQGPATP